MRYVVQPYTMTGDGMKARVESGSFMMTAPSALGCKRNGATDKAEHYQARMAHAVDVASEEDAIAEMWDLYQNIDENRLTPDRKQSMQSGDLVFCHTTGQWWLCCSFGWDRIEKPAWA